MKKTIEANYLQPREGLLSFPATTGPYNEKKWEKLFTAGVDNDTSEKWETVTGCTVTPAGKMSANDLVKNGMYREFIKNEAQNFFTGIESAFQAVENNPSLVKELLESVGSYRRIHVPFTNTKGFHFVVNIYNYLGRLRAVVHGLSETSVWVTSRSVVLLPHVT